MIPNLVHYNDVTGQKAGLVNVWDDVSISWSIEGPGVLHQ